MLRRFVYVTGALDDLVGLATAAPVFLTRLQTPLDWLGCVFSTVSSR